MELRDYQERAVTDAINALSEKKRVWLQLPTGAGKTVIGKEVANRWNGKVRVVVHRRELVIQWNPMDARTVQTVTRKTFKDPETFSPDDLLIVDECHHYVDNTWETAIKKFPGRVLGLSATPWRAAPDLGFDKLWGRLICGPTKARLVQEGFIVPSVLKNSKFGVIEGRGKSSDGDFSMTATMEAFSDTHFRQSAMIEQSVAWLLKEAPEGQSIIFAMNVRHAKALTEETKKRGISSSLITADTPSGERRDTFTEFKAGKTRALVTVAVLTEGVDLPVCDTVLLVRPTRSLALYLQMVGRCLRAYPGKKHGLVLDAAGNHSRLGHPDDDHVWSLAPRITAVAPTWDCPNCQLPNKYTLKECAQCGWIRHIKGRPRAPRIKCGRCGVSRRADIPACQACAYDASDAKPDFNARLRTIHYRNLTWVWEGDEYTAEIPAIESRARLREDGGWTAKIEALDTHSVLYLITKPGEDRVSDVFTGDLPWKVVDEATDRVKKYIGG